jgi:hypothetical protein
MFLPVTAHHPAVHLGGHQGDGKGARVLRVCDLGQRLFPPIITVTIIPLVIRRLSASPFFVAPARDEEASETRSTGCIKLAVRWFHFPAGAGKPRSGRRASAWLASEESPGGFASHYRRTASEESPGGVHLAIDKQSSRAGLTLWHFSSTTRHDASLHCQGRGRPLSHDTGQLNFALPQALIFLPAWLGGAEISIGGPQLRVQGPSCEGLVMGMSSENI